MVMKRDDQGRLVFVEMVDGVETITKIIPKHEEQLYLRRGSLEGDRNKDFPAKAEADKVQEMERPYDVHVHMEGGKVSRYDEQLKDLPDHPESRKPEHLQRASVDVNTGEAISAAEYSLMGVNYDPGEVVEDEPVEEQK